MKLRNCIGLLVAGLTSLLTVTESDADQIPAALRGNSVILTWSSSRLAKSYRLIKKSAGFGETNFGSNYTTKIYISNKGRFFSSFETAAKHLGQSAYEVNGNGRETPLCNFQGKTLICFKGASQNGARKLTVNFSDDFRRCSLDVVIAKKSGAEHMLASGAEIISEETTSTNCTVQSGNVFAQ